MDIGDAVVIDGRVNEVLRITPEGDLYVQDSSTLERRWVDYYRCTLIDPHTNGGALLEAMGALRDEDLISDAPTSMN